MSPFEIIVLVAGVIMGFALMVALVLIMRCHRDTNRAVLSDAVFYPMIGLFLLLSLVVETSIAYEVVLLGGLLGILTSVSTARILSKGRR